MRVELRALTRGNALLELVGLHLVVDLQRVQVLRRAQLELRDALRFLDDDFCGVSRRTRLLEAFGMCLISPRAISMNVFSSVISFGCPVQLANRLPFLLF